MKTTHRKQHIQSLRIANRTEKATHPINENFTQKTAHPINGQPRIAHGEQDILVLLRLTTAAMSTTAAMYADDVDVDVC